MVDSWRLNDQKMSKINAGKTVKQFKSVNPLTAISLTTLVQSLKQIDSE